jgi:hypothetical protein
MGSFYRLQIKCNKEQQEKLDFILGKSNDFSEVSWSLVVEEDSPVFTTALDHFSNLITNNLVKLKEIEVSMDMITFWVMYEYEQQCNLEFWPDMTKKIGELGVVLCISCWEK